MLVIWYFVLAAILPSHDTPCKEATILDMNLGIGENVRIISVFWDMISFSPFRVTRYFGETLVHCPRRQNTS
jgi:hypothetical protein